MSERIDHAPAFILHTRPWRETSLIVDVFARGHGRLGLVARGARRAGAAVKTRIVPFQPLTLSWFGKAALKTLHDAEWQGGALSLSGHALMCGFYLNELLLRLLPEGDAHDGLYDRYVATLHALNASGAEFEPALRRFELGLLAELGYAQPLAHLPDGRAPEPEARYAFEPGVGIRPARGGQTGYRGKTLLDLAAGELADAVTLAEGKLLMRALISHYLGEKPLATRQLLIDLQKL